MPAAWQSVVDEAPMDAETFRAATLADWAKTLWDAVQGTARAPLRLLAKLCGVVLLTALVRGLAGDEGGGMPELLDSVGALAVFTLCGTPVLALMGTLQAAIEDSRNYLACFVPVFASVMTTCGQSGAALVYSGLFFGTASAVAGLLCSVFLPATRIFLALHAAAALGGALDLQSITDALARWMKWLLGFCATVIAALLGLQSALAQSADTLALKTGKFLVSSGVPVVGRAMSDAMGSVLAGLRLLKGTVGFAAVAAIAAAFIPVLLECLLYHIVFTLGGTVAGSVGSEKTKRFCFGVTQCLSLYISMIFFFSLLVICATVLMILLGNGGA